ncbi:SPX domain-containing protein [Ganoderma leucocontextum]|nr:SPX domain-containing protein [Ganoderma leucocontextum]
MHFSKTYAQLLLTLPPDLRESAIQYRQLKKIINQVVAELTSLGLSPDVLQGVIQPPSQENNKGKQKEDSLPDSKLAPHASGPRVVYEFADVVDHVEPRLHLYLDDDDVLQSYPIQSIPMNSSGLNIPLPISQHILQLALSPSTQDPDTLDSFGDDHFLAEDVTSITPHELIIPLASDTAFFRTLSDALASLSEYLIGRKAEFETTLQSLSQDISSASRPSSSTSSFHPYSPFSSDVATIAVSSTALAINSKSDLETWREIFQMYMEADIFQGHQERFRGERDLEDAAARLAAFSSALRERSSVGRLKLSLKRSKVALRTFMELNTFILDLRKFQHVTTEATRKILKKHAKRTALPLAPDMASPFTINAEARDRALVLSRSTSQHANSLSLSLLLVQALTETLLPIIPHIDDYSCVICTSLAFKPIRLRCSHLFCVRCLVKLQKRGEEHCPMCRAPTVLSADRSNVDWALLNFMNDWFPNEARKKLQQNEREAAEEEMRELGLDVRGCVLM